MINSSGLYARLDELQSHTGTRFEISWVKDLQNATVFRSKGGIGGVPFPYQAKIQSALAKAVPVPATEYRLIKIEEDD